MVMQVSNAVAKVQQLPLNDLSIVFLVRAAKSLGGEVTQFYWGGAVVYKGGYNAYAKMNK